MNAEDGSWPVTTYWLETDGKWFRVVGSDDSQSSSMKHRGAVKLRDRLNLESVRLATKKNVQWVRVK